MSTVERRNLRVLVLMFSIAVALLSPGQAAGQGAAVSGTVVARATGQPIPDAAVVVEGSSAASATNGLGRFELTAPSTPATLLVSAPGYLELRVPDVQVQTSLVVELDATPNYLETVQVTATKSAQSVGDVAAPTATVSRGTIERRGDLRVTLSARNLFNAEYSFDGNSESADPGPTRQVLLSTTIRLR